MLVDALGDERMGDLEQQRARPGAEQQQRLAVQPPRLGAGPVQPGGVGDPLRIAARIPLDDHLHTIARPMPEPTRARWGADFDPDRLAALETRMWKAYYRRQPARLFGLLVMGMREQAHVSWPRALAASVFLTKAAAGFARASGDYERFAPDIVRGYRILGLDEGVDLAEVARWELRWWVVRREIGLAAGEAAGDAIARTYAALYRLPPESVAEAGRLRGVAAEVRDRGAVADPEGPGGPGRAYWPEVARLLRDSYRSLKAALEAPAETPARTASTEPEPLAAGAR